MDEVFLTFLRHGRSRADDEGVHEGRYDSPLTLVGRGQVRRRGKEFVSRDFHFDRIVCSTLQRAHETAQIIGQLLKVPVEPDPDWMEIDNGPLAGLPFSVAEERYPRPTFRNPNEPPLGTGESEWELYCRAARTLEKVVRRGPGSYLVVAHGGILNAAIKTIAGAIPAANHQGMAFRFNDTGYARWVYYPSRHAWHLLEFKPGD